MIRTVAAAALFELRRHLRSAFAFRALALATTLTCAFPLLISASTDRSGATSQAIFAAFFLVQLGGLLVLGPAAAAGSIAGERESGTFEVLQMSPLGAGAIVAAKLVAIGGFLLLVLVAAVPVAASCSLIGGIRFATIIGAYAVLLLSALLFTIAALEASAASRTTLVALFRGLFYGLLLAGLGPLVAAMQGGAGGRLGALQFSSPFAALLAVLRPLDAPAAVPVLGLRLGPAIAFVLFACLASLVGLAVLAWRLRYTTRLDAISHEHRFFRLSLARRRFSLGGPLAESPGAPVLDVVDERPVFAREMATSALVAPSISLLLFVLFTGACAHLASIGTPREGLAFSGFLSLAVFGVLSPAIGVSLIVRERVERTLDPLWLTPMPLADILRQKRSFGVRACGAGIAGALHGTLIGRATNGFASGASLLETLWQLLVLAVFLFVTVRAGVSVGLRAAAIPRSAPRTYVMAYLRVFTYLVLLPLAAGILSCGLLAVPLNSSLAYVFVIDAGLGGFDSALLAAIVVVFHSLLLEGVALSSVESARRKFRVDPVVADPPARGAPGSQGRGAREWSGMASSEIEW